MTNDVMTDNRVQAIDINAAPNLVPGYAVCQHMTLMREVRDDAVKTHVEPVSCEPRKIRLIPAEATRGRTLTDALRRLKSSKSECIANARVIDFYHDNLEHFPEAWKTGQRIICPGTAYSDGVSVVVRALRYDTVGNKLREELFTWQHQPASRGDIEEPILGADDRIVVFEF